MGRTEARSRSAPVAHRRTTDRARGGDGHGGRARNAQAPGGRPTPPTIYACVSTPRPCPAPTSAARPRRSLTERCLIDVCAPTAQVASRFRESRRDPGETLIPTAPTGGLVRLARCLRMRIYTRESIAQRRHLVRAVFVDGRAARRSSSSNWGDAPVTVLCFASCSRSVRWLGAPASPPPRFATTNAPA
jgi:hypothetical protein